MKRFKINFISGVWLVFVLFALNGCSETGDQTSASKETATKSAVSGGIYRMPLPSNPTTLDPARVKDIYGGAVIRQLFDGLVRFDAYLTVLPALARTWQVQDEGRIYRFELRDNARFHNGDPVTAGDVVFSISRLIRLDPPTDILPHLLKIVGAEQFRNGEVDRVEGLKVISPLTVEIRLISPHMPFLTALGMYQASILSERAVQDSSAGFAVQPVGSGPFKFLDWKPNQSIELERFDEYYGKPAFLDGIHFKIFATGQDSSQLMAFEHKEIEEMPVYGDVRKKLADQVDLKWVRRPSLSLFFYGMNCRHPHLKNPYFRKALSAAIDRTDFVNQVYSGQFDIARTILPPGMPGYSPATPLPDNAKDLARQYLDQAIASGLDHIQELEMVSAFQTPRVAAEMQMIQDFWADLGVLIQVRYITDWTEFQSYIRSDAVQLYRYVWLADMPDPDSILDPLFSSESPNNFMQYHDPVVDELLKLGRETLDPLARVEVYHKLESQIKASLPLIPLFYMSVDQVYQPYVRGIEVSALGAHAIPFSRVWLDHAVLP
jgi:ABC-type transport system substrate-binding protein